MGELEIENQLAFYILALPMSITFIQFFIVPSYVAFLDLFSTYSSVTMCIFVSINTH